MIWISQRRGHRLGWPSDLDAALKQSAAEGRSLLIFFRNPIADEETQDVIKRLLLPGDAQKALRKGNFLQVQANLDPSLQSPTAKKYKILRLPTMIIISPEGEELNRRVGYIAFMEFLGPFLNCTEIVKQ